MNKHGGYTGNKKDILDFSININPLGMPGILRKNLGIALDNLGTYPEITGETARKKIATDIGMPSENIILGNGAIELIYLFARSIKPKSALIPVPTFNEYQRALNMNGCKNIQSLVLTEENGFELTVENLLKKWTTFKAEVVYLCNPTNPTGKLYSKAFIKSLMDCLPKETIWFIDESFIEFSDIETSLEAVKNSDHRLFLLRSLTKFFGVPGIRIGYGVGSKALIKAMEAYKEPWTINTLALTAAMCVYDDKDYIKKTQDTIKKERERVYQSLKNLPRLKVYPSGADFHLYELAGITAQDMHVALLEKGINIRTCEDFAGLETQFFRAAIKEAHHNDLLIKSLNEILGG